VSSFGPFAVAIAFWIFVAVATVAGIVGGYRKRRVELEPLKAAIERGQPLDPAVIDRILQEKAPQKLDPQLIRIGGIITVASGVGVVLLSLILGAQIPQARLPIMGAGVLTICVGVGLLIAARSMVKPA
jgi:hypothetical protein